MACRSSVYTGEQPPSLVSSLISAWRKLSRYGSQQHEVSPRSSHHSISHVWSARNLAWLGRTAAAQICKLDGDGLLPQSGITFKHEYDKQQANQDANEEIITCFAATNHLVPRPHLKSSALNSRRVQQHSGTTNSAIQIRHEKSHSAAPATSSELDTGSICRQRWQNVTFARIVPRYH